MPRALFYGLFMAAVALGVFEAINLLGSETVSGADRWLAALYAAAPYIVGGLGLGSVTAALASIWAGARRATMDDSQPGGADATAALLALGIFASLLFGGARAVQGSGGALGGLLLALFTPFALVAAFYAWAVLRRVLADLDERVGRHASRILGGVIVAFGLALVVTSVARNEALTERLGWWVLVFSLAYPVLTALLAFILHQWSPSGLQSPSARRAVILVGIVALVGTGDVVINMDARAEVKQALLADTLAFHPLVFVTQPLFDADRDGYAGLLGGGDCDDTNPGVHPGARELPRNGLDDDCFAGDSPGVRIRRARPVEPNAPRLELPSRPDIVLVTVDTLRADHLGYMGYERETSPILDAFAGQSMRFRWAFAPGCQTKVTMPAVFTGKYFSELQRSPGHWPRLHDDNVMLAERLKAANYRTVGVPAHNFFKKHYNMLQGFEVWDDTLIEEHGTKMAFVISGKQVTDRALHWLAEHRARPKRRPLFLWVHYFDPHHVYKDHPEFDFGRRAVDLYDEEIRYTDTQLGRLLQALQPLDRTYVMLHSDHGEGFGEHGYRYHGQMLYNDQTHVPLLLAGPGLASRWVETPVSLLDIVPTVMELAGKPVKPGMHGVSLLPWALPDPPEHPPVFTEMPKDAKHSSRRSMVWWPYKLQYSITFNQYMLHNLAKDPGEQQDLAGSKPKDFERLQARLRKWMAEEVEASTPRR